MSGQTTCWTTTIFSTRRNTDGTFAGYRPRLKTLDYDISCIPCRLSPLRSSCAVRPRGLVCRRYVAARAAATAPYAVLRGVRSRDLPAGPYASSCPYPPLPPAGDRRLQCAAPQVAVAAAVAAGSPRDAAAGSLSGRAPGRCTERARRAADPARRPGRSKHCGTEARRRCRTPGFREAPEKPQAQPGAAKSVGRAGITTCRR